jgi:hypothetical protein
MENNDNEKIVARAKRTKTAIIILAVLSGLALIGVITILIIETNNSNSPKNIRSVCFVVVDDGRNRTRIQIESIKKFISFECSVLVVSTSNGIEMENNNEDDVKYKIYSINHNEAKNAMDVFFNIVKNGIENIDDVSHWMFLGDNIILQKNLKKSDMFINNNIKFFNLTQVDTILFEILENPPSAPSCLLENVKYEFIKNLLDVKIEFGTRNDLVYAPSINQVKLFTSNLELNNVIGDIKKTKLEKFATFFISSAVEDKNTREKIENFITKKMEQSL